MRQCKSCRNWIHYDDECCPVCQALVERDEARAAMAAAFRVKDDLREEFNQVCRERDVARGLACRYRLRLPRRVADQEGTAEQHPWLKKEGQR